MELAEEKKKKKGKMVIAGFNDDKTTSKKARAATFIRQDQISFDEVARNTVADDNNGV